MIELLSMKERGDEAYAQAEEEIPVRWYEYEHMLRITTGISFILFALGVIKFGVPSHHLMGGVSYLLSAIADEQSTLAIFKANDKALQEGLDFSLEEVNPSISHVRSADDYIAAKKITLKRNAILTGVSLIIPPAGIGFAASKIFATVSNRRNERRINRAVEIATAESVN